MYSDYYQAELAKLRQNARVFAEHYPLLAPHLHQVSQDPDVERLLEGTAYLTAGIQQRLDDEYPMFLYHLAQTLCPMALLPMPAATIMQFSPRKGSAEKICVPKGTYMDSDQTDAGTFRFSSCFDVDVWPLQVTAVDAGNQSGEQILQPGSNRIRIDLQAMKVPLETLPMEKLRFYLGGDFAGATDLYYIINHYLQSVEVINGSGNRIQLSKDVICSVGFAKNENLLPKQNVDLNLFSTIHEFFHFPEKHLFIDIDLRQWQQRIGEQFQLVLHFINLPIPLPELSLQRFTLYATPAVNLYTAEAEPLLLEHHNSAYPLLIKGANQHAQIYSVDRVEGLRRGVKERRKYRSYSEFVQAGSGEAIYHLKRNYSAQTDRMDLFLVPTYTRRTHLDPGEILRVGLTVTDGVATHSLQPGQITHHTMNTPQRVTFTNLTVPKGSRGVPDDENLLWHLISHISLQRASLASAEALRSYVSHYALLAHMAHAGANLAQRRVDGLVDLKVTASDRLSRGRLYQGQIIEAKIRKDCFISHGDRYLFGRLLDDLFQSLAPINFYSAFVMLDLDQEERIEWPIRLGKQTLI